MIFQGIFFKITAWSLAARQYCECVSGFFLYLRQHAEVGSNEKKQNEDKNIK